MAINIRKATEGDFEFIANLMTKALSPYYGGDHKAHAQRIFSTHTSGGHDNVGHFSLEQTMFIGEVRGSSAGLIHIVGKRQGTFKISPLIIANEYCGKYGVGSALLSFAEKYAQNNQARQIYCTVAKQNHGALQFFLKKGYVIAGKSHSHYKPGITEIMLYKLFVSKAVQIKFDEPNISVTSFNEERHKKQVSEMMIELLPCHFGSVNQDWIEALYKGYRCRNIKDINAKYKLIFVAVDRQDNVLGIIGATPKKGEPIKLMPFVAQTHQGFIALLVDIPHLLKELGRKLYVHLVPSVEEVFALQRFGWSLDCMLPAAYHDKHTTQQWSFNYGDKFMRSIRVKKRFFDLISSGLKTLEVRVGYDSIKSIQIGERICFATSNESQVVKIKDIRIYQSFQEMLAIEDLQRIAPDIKKNKISGLLKKIYPPNREKLGVYVFEIESEKI